ncbi:MAG: hypothetical protein C4527_00840 [Candidatus Omnitrophota bacterium]|jgi:hypothetical protein|nr:MAG: hypothetical protein C4527_00840 [Candidatus Omnitrophota bacterium]
MWKISIMGFVGSCLLVFTVSPQAQLVKQINFSAAEGYVDGLLVGQPAGSDSKWTAASEVQGENCFTVQNEAMLVHPDGSGVIWLYIDFPVPKQGPLTATWDWQYFGPPEKKMDLGFTIGDLANYMTDGDPFTVFNEQSSITRMGDVIDARNGDWEGGGQWISTNGVPYRDGVLVHMRMVVDLVDWVFDIYAQREGEAEALVADDFLFRRAPTNETGGVNGITMWLNGGDPETRVVLDNILLVGPEPYVAVNQWDLY